MDEYDLSVHNRWGQLMFRNDGMPIQWDGRSGGEILNGGTYIVQVRYLAGRRRTNWRASRTPPEIIPDQLIRNDKKFGFADNMATPRASLRRLLDPMLSQPKPRLFCLRCCSPNGLHVALPTLSPRSWTPDGNTPLTTTTSPTNASPSASCFSASILVRLAQIVEQRKSEVERRRPPVGWR